MGKRVFWIKVTVSKVFSDNEQWTMKNEKKAINCSSLMV
jgi:hypothetical protein